MLVTICPVVGSNQACALFQKAPPVVWRGQYQMPLSVGGDGDITLRAEAKGLEPATLTISVKQ